MKLLACAALVLLTGCTFSTSDTGRTLQCFVRDVPTAHIEGVGHVYTEGSTLTFRNYQGEWYYHLAQGEFCRLEK